MAQAAETRPLPELIGGLASDVSSLFRKEIELAKAEASEKAAKAGGAVASIGIGAVLAIGALGVILAAIVSAIAAMLVANGMAPPTATTVAGAVVGIVCAIVAWIFVSRGVAELKASSLRLDRTTEALGRDAALIKEKM